MLRGRAVAGGVGGRVDTGPAERDPARLDEQVEARLRQELEEFDLLRSASTPAAAWRPLTCRCRSNSYVAPEVADEGEMLLAFVAHLPYESARAQQG